MKKNKKLFGTILITVVVLGLSSYLVAQQKININTASAEHLETLPGIGPAKAQDIVKYREENGNFATIEGLKKVPGIGDRIFEHIQELITVNEETKAEKAPGREVAE